jgi:hypothetical protein
VGVKSLTAAEGEPEIGDGIQSYLRHAALEWGK